MLFFVGEVGGRGGMRIVSVLLLKRWRPQLETAVRPDSPRETVAVLYYFCRDIRTTSRAGGWSGVHRLAVVFDIPRFFFNLTHGFFFFLSFRDFSRRNVRGDECLWSCVQNKVHCSVTLEKSLAHWMSTRGTKEFLFSSKEGQCR